MLPTLRGCKLGVRRTLGGAASVEERRAIDPLALQLVNALVAPFGSTSCLPVSKVQLLLVSLDQIERTACCACLKALALARRQPENELRGYHKRPESMAEEEQ
jgi:hypothetical protein